MVAHLLWEQGVEGSNPFNPTYDVDLPIVVQLEFSACAAGSTLACMRAEDFPPLDAETHARWSNFLGSGTEYFASRIGIELEEVRQDYARVRLPWIASNTQPAGVIHGGAIATIIDTVVVPAIGSGIPEDALWSTIELNVQFLRGLTGAAVGEGWIVRRGRSVIFTRAEVKDEEGRLVAVGTATYAVRMP